MEIAVPWIFQWMMTRHFHSTSQVAGQVWRHYCQRYPYQSMTLRYHLDQGEQALDAGDETRLVTALRRLQDLLPPAHLFSACAALAPEGPPRRQDIRAFEAALLRHLRPVGGWTGGQRTSGNLGFVRWPNIP